MTGKALEDAMQKQPWDPSVKALTAVPQTLQMMNDSFGGRRNSATPFLSIRRTCRRGAAATCSCRQRGQPEDDASSKGSQEFRGRRLQRGTGAAPRDSLRDRARQRRKRFTCRCMILAWCMAPGPMRPISRSIGIRQVISAGSCGDLEPGCFRRRGDLGRHELAESSTSTSNVNRYNQFNRANINNANWTHNAAHRVASATATECRQPFWRPGTEQVREAARQKAGQGKGAMGARAAGEGEGPGGKAMGRRQGWQGRRRKAGRQARAVWAGKGHGAQWKGAPRAWPGRSEAGWYGQGSPKGGMARRRSQWRWQGPKGGNGGEPEGFSGPKACRQASSSTGGGRGFSGAMAGGRAECRSGGRGGGVTRRRTAVRCKPQARRRPSRAARQWPRLLSIQILTAATRPTSASWRRRCKRSCRRLSCAVETAT